METFADFLAAIEDSEQRLRVTDALEWICTTYSLRDKADCKTFWRQ